MIEVSKIWLEILEIFLKTSGTMVVLGDVNTGKSTFCRWICSQLVSASKLIAFLDADLGQTDLGPPGCISLGVFNNLPLEFSVRNFDNLFLVGSTTPVRHLLMGVTGVSKLACIAQKKEVSHIVVNTTGWIKGGAAIAYKQAKIDVLSPSILVIFERGRELSPIFRANRKLDSLKILKVPVSSLVKVRNQTERKDMRMKKFNEYFDSSLIIKIKTEHVGICGLYYHFLNEDVVNQIISLDNRAGGGIALGKVLNFNRKERVFEILTPCRCESDNIGRLNFQGFYQ
jgi:polynucleotide 5'-hydroxyl-kinase GRC3/NOL9